MDELLIELARNLKADRRRARRIGVVFGLSAIAAPFVFLGLMPLGGRGGAESPWTPVLLPLFYSVVFLSPVLIGAGFALLGVGLALRKREDWLKDQAINESPEAIGEFIARRRRDARVLFGVSSSLLVLELAGFLGLAYLYNVNQAWDHAQKGPTYYNAPMTQLFLQLVTWDSITAPILLAAGAVLLLTGIAILRHNRAILGKTNLGETNGEPSIEQQ